VLPYDNNAHPRILLRVFLTTAFSLGSSYREIRIMQGRDNDKAKREAALITGSGDR